VSNTESDVVVEIEDRRHFVLLSGRWFAGSSMEGPWTFVPSDELPASFTNIPNESGPDHAIPLRDHAGLSRVFTIDVISRNTATVYVPLSAGPIAISTGNLWNSPFYARVEAESKPWPSITLQSVPSIIETTLTHVSVAARCHPSSTPRCPDPATIPLDPLTHVASPQAPSAVPEPPSNLQPASPDLYL